MSATERDCLLATLQIYKVPPNIGSLDKQGKLNGMGRQVVNSTSQRAV